MAKQGKNMVVGSLIAAGVVAVLAVLDLALAYPFNRALYFDIACLIGAGIVLWQGWGVYQKLT
jgi:hypothetical protein